MQKPWNMIDVPVYSLATYDVERVNMNICTYVTAVSMKPKQYIVAVYQNTKSLENLKEGKTAVLQLLHRSQVRLVKTLGKTSGKTYDKDRYLRKYNHLEQWKGYDVLRNTSATLLLRQQWSRITGDHTLFLFDVMAHRSTDGDMLTLRHLREKKIIRI
jgi:flavin reductase (DIM6/NTAB) family NADH-FMN oxidoreductase RutF